MSSWRVRNWRLGLGFWMETSTRSPSRAVPVSRRGMWTRSSATRSMPVARFVLVGEFRKEERVALRVELQGAGEGIAGLGAQHVGGLLAFLDDALAAQRLDGFTELRAALDGTSRWRASDDLVTGWFGLDRMRPRIASRRFSPSMGGVCRRLASRRNGKGGNKCCRPGISN